MKTTKAITLDLYKTDKGLEVCRLSNNEKCPFLGARNMGFIPVCMVSGNDLYDVQGYVEPETNCFLRKEQKC